MPTFGECETTLCIPLITLEEEKSKITFRNPQRRAVRKVKVDGCAIKQGLRCDYLLLDWRNVQHYIELKGSKVRHAVRQIEATIQDGNLREKLEDEAGEKRAYVIFSGSCDAPRTDIPNMKSEFRKRYKGTLLVKRTGYAADL